MGSLLSPSRAKWIVAAALALLTVLALALGTAGGGTAGNDVTFPETNAKVYGPFADYWRANGGLDRFGRPLTGVVATQDGFAGQWFERAVLVYYPGNPLEYRVQPQNLGWQLAALRCAQPAFARAVKATDGMYFDATGHNLAGKFLQYWQANAGDRSFGVPLSEAYVERNRGNGKDYLLQYFERARFEAENGPAAAQAVTLGLLGVERLATLGGPQAFASLQTPAFYPRSSPGTPGPARTLPKMGFGEDYGFIAGKVEGISAPPRGVERPSGPPLVAVGARPLEAPAATDEPTPLPNGVIVGTAVHGDTSPPLREITPLPAIAGCRGETASLFLPLGPGWDPSKVKDGDFVVLYGRLATPADAVGTGDRGRPYYVTKMELNP